MIRKPIIFFIVLVLAGAAGLSAQVKTEPAKPVTPADRAGPMNAITDVPGIEVGS